MLEAGWIRSRDFVVLIVNAVLVSEYRERRVDHFYGVRIDSRHNAIAIPDMVLVANVTGGQNSKGVLPFIRNSLILSDLRPRLCYIMRNEATETLYKIFRAGTL